MVRRAQGLLWALALAAVGCGPRVVEYKVNVVTTACDASADPFAGAKYLTVRVTGDGIAQPLIANSEVSTRSAKVPEIPAGAGRVIQIRVYGAEGPGSKVLSWGQSLPFDVPDMLSDPPAPPVAINVFLRKVDAFTPLAAVTNPKTCAEMKVPRGGHTATLLQNGKVFISGGFRLKEGTQERIALADAELYNPQTGALESARSISVGTQVLPMAFHTATLLPNGVVLIWGGEQYLGGAANLPAPRATAMLYDPDADDYRGVPSRTVPKNLVRSRHSAAMDKDGRVLIVGGISRDEANQLVNSDKVEWFDPVTNKTGVVDQVTLVRLDAAVSAVQGGALIAVAGGSDGAQLVRDVKYFAFNGTDFAMTGGPQLQFARRASGVSTVRDGNDLLLFGGYGDRDNVAPLNSTELVATRQNTVGAGPAAGSRGESCVATLKDGSLLVIGGRTVDALGQPPHSDATVTHVVPLASGGFQPNIAPSLPAPRYGHTCTTLADGAVLVLGGLKEAAGTIEVLKDALIYQPPPAD